MVDGEHFDDAAGKLDLEGRLELLDQLIEAVAVAHDADAVVKKAFAASNVGKMAKDDAVNDFVHSNGAACLRCRKGHRA